MATVAVPPSQEAIAQLQQYTACDISDALLKLKVPKAGFIADLNPYHGNANTNANAEQAAVTVAPVSTVLFTPKDEDTSTGIERPAPNFPKDTHWVDNAVPGTFAVLRQPEGQTNAVCGGIMALRMKVLGVKGIIVSGRIRDLAELQSTGLPVRKTPHPPLHMIDANPLHKKIWARGTSTVGSGGSSTPWAMQVPLDIDGVVVSPGDLAMNDLINGVVIIPQDKVDKVLELLPQLTSADDKAKEDVANGVSVKEAFRRHRGA
jgi:regulator of RNase E activity RraA